MQVAISVVAACMWMLENPRRGVCVPDDLPHDYVLDISKPYLGKFISMASDWNPLKHYSNVFARLQPAAARPVRSVAVQEFPDHRRRLVDEKTLLRLAKTHGTPLVVVDHKVLRENYAQFRKYLPRVQVYYAVKANSAPEIVQTFYEAGASFDVASVAEFLTVHENIKDLPDEQRQDFIWDRIIYANPIKATETLEQLDPYKPLVTYDNHEEVIKIARHAPHAGLVLRLRVPNTGSMVELSSKFGALPGEAVDLIAFAHNNKLEVEGLSFHVGSQCTNVQNYIQALHLAVEHLRRSQDARLRAQAARHRRRLSRPLRRHRPGLQDAGQGDQPGAGPAVSAADRDSRRAGRFLVASAATAVAQIIGKAVRDGKLCYYIE